MLTFLRKGVLLTGATVPAPCQVRSKTGSPCPRRAAAEMLGVAFCGPCAREQEAYFAIGELVAQEEAQGLCGRALTEALKGVWRERAGGREGISAAMPHGLSGVYGTKPLVLSSR